MASHSTSRADAAARADDRLDLVITGRPMLRWAVVVIVVVIIAEVAARGVMGRTTEEIRWYDAAAQQRIELLDERGEDVEVAFAGTSAAWQAFVPAEFTRRTGRPSVNAGLAGAVPTVMGPWLTEEIAPRVAPDLVVWGLTPLDFAPAYGEQQVDAYTGAVETADGWLAEVDRSVSSVSTLISARRVLRSPSDLFGTGEERRADDLAAARIVTGADGERTDFEVDVSAQGAAIQRSRLERFAVDRRDVDAVTTAVRSLQAGGTTVVLVELPIPDRFAEQLPQPAANLAATRSSIQAIGESTASDVVLMGDVFGDTNFVDHIHLDAGAAAQTTRWLSDLVGELATREATGCGFVDVVDEIGFLVPIEVCRNQASG